MEFVLIQRDIIWSRAQDFSQLTAGRATEKIHLPQSIGGRRVALSEVEILVVLRFNVGNPTLVATDGDAILQAFDLDRVLLRGRLPGGSHAEQTKKWQQQEW